MAAVQQLGDTAAACAWLRARGARGLGADTRSLAPGDALLAWPGARHDPRRQLRDLLSGPVPAVLVEAQGSEPLLDGLPPEAVQRVARFEGLRRAAGPIAHAFHDRPSEALEVVAVTGTNGKTSVSWGVAQALRATGRRCAVAGTLGIGEPGGTLVSTGLTTPDAVALHGALARLRATGVAALALEASSIGLVEGRLDGCHIAVACFTHLTQDHLDYHGTMADYWAAKQRLFDWPGLRAAVVNVATAHGRELVQRLAAERPTVTLWTVQADGEASEARLTLHGEGLDGVGRQRLRLREGGDARTLASPLVGDFNRENLVVVAGALRALGLSLDAVAEGLGAVQPVPGRLQPVAAGPGEPQVVVDYAHTPDALRQVLRTLQPVARARGGRLWCLFGCGGNRDRAKRPRMAEAAEALADHLVLTSDNPRDEAPAAILAEVVSGLQAPERATVIEDRRAAIAFAVARADARDLVLLAGKGHEAEQEIAGVRHPFDDAVEAAHALAARRGAAA